MWQTAPGSPSGWMGGWSCPWEGSVPGPCKSGHVEEPVPSPLTSLLQTLLLSHPWSGTRLMGQVQRKCQKTKHLGD